MAKNIKHPLVSVTVLTYNSSKYVIETLESIKAQTYENIELIISDDCSTDTSVALCKSWLKKNKDRFAESHIITSDINTGIPANKNRSLKKCKGEWIKGIGADDLLIEDAITNLYDYSQRNTDVQIVASITKHFIIRNGRKEFLKIKNLNNSIFFNNKITGNEQYKLLLKTNFIDAPSVFMKKSILMKFGGYIEKYTYIEDTPMWLMLTNENLKIHYLPKITVLYRRHVDSISGTVLGDKLFSKAYLNNRLFYKEMIRPNVNFFFKLRKDYEFFVFSILDYFGLNYKKSIISNFIFYLLLPRVALRRFFKV